VCVGLRGDRWGVDLCGWRGGGVCGWRGVWADIIHPL
jgi:hypothetical protein